MANIINTRLILRNDELSAWEQSQKVLLKGEAALARLTDENRDKYEIRIGTGDKTWQELSPCNLVIPYTSISGMPAGITYALSVSDNSLSAALISSDGTSSGQAGTVFSAQGLSDAITALNDSLSNATSGLVLSVSNLSNQLFDSESGAIPALCTDITNTLSNAITGISDSISNAETGLSSQVTSLSTAIYADSTGLSSKVGALQTDVGTLSNTTIPGITGNVNSISTAITGTNGITANISTLSDDVEALKNWQTKGITYIGQVSAIDTQTSTYVKPQGEPTAFENGDLVILNGVEYVWSSEAGTAEQFGDEGNLASKNYVSAALSAVKNTHYEIDGSISALSDIAEPEGGFIAGDIAVKKIQIADTGKYTYAAYVWDPTLKANTGDWAAMDGNYDAENVYFNEDFTYTNAIGALAAPAQGTGSGSLSAKGRSLEAVLSSILNKEKSGTKTNPAITINTEVKSVEYGEEVSPSYKMTFSPGSYLYGPPTGVELSTDWQVKANGNLSTLNGSIASTVVSGTLANIIATYGSETTLVSSIYVLSAKVGHTAGATPYTNLGNEDTSASAPKIASNSALTASKAIYNVYRPRYVMFTSSTSIAAPTALSAADLSSCTTKTGADITLSTANTWYKMTDSTWPTKIQIKPGSYVNIYFAAPTGIKTNWSAKKSDNVNVLNTPAAVEIPFKYLNGDAGTYKLYSITNADTFTDTFCNITWN